MTAEILRRAAKLMRERAEAASPPARPRWEAWQTVQAAEYHVGIAGRGWSGHVASPSRSPEDYGKGYAEHIASWDPAVALAVADLLTVFSMMPSASDPTDLNVALVVARAYLGESE